MKSGDAVMSLGDTMNARLIFARGIFARLIFARGIFARLILWHEGVGKAGFKQSATTHSGTGEKETLQHWGIYEKG